MDGTPALYKNIKDIIGTRKLTIQVLIVLTPKIIKFIQEVGIAKKLSGAEKKELFFSIIKEIVDDSTLTVEEKTNINDFIDSSYLFKY